MDILNTVYTSMGGSIQTVLAFLVAVSILVFVHEFGHFYVARRNGVKVETFSIGFGKELFGWNDKHGTHWRVALLPLGGFVKMYGDLDPASAEADPTVKALSESEKFHAFFAKSIPQRAAIVAAGPLINFLFAFIVFFGVFATVGRQYTPPVIDGLVENYPAAKAGLLQGDVVVSVNNQPIERFQDIGRIVSLWTSGPLPVIIKRGDATMEFSLEPMLAETTNNLGVKGQKPKIGVVSQSSIEFEKVGLVGAVTASVDEIWQICASSLTGLYQMIIGERDTSELGGILTIAKVSGEMANGVASDIYFLGFLSVSLGLINLFPIPVLDGGHLLFYALESVRGRPLGDRAQEYSLRFGLAVVLSLTVLALWNDLQNLGIVVFIKNLFT